jgi:hypothetical protein
VITSGRLGLQSGSQFLGNRVAPPAEYLARANGPMAGRVFPGGIARLELGGRRPNNHWQYTL